MSGLVIYSPSRLHIGLLNESGMFQRIDGGLGISVSDPCWRLKLEKGTRREHIVYGLATEFRKPLLKILNAYTRDFELPPVRLNVMSEIQAHIGLGSKTSLLYSVCSAVNEILGLNWDSRELAAYAGRGGTSGVGVHGCRHGGFIWDAGRRFPSQKSWYGPSSKSTAQLPALIFQSTLDWLCVVHFRFGRKGFSGAKEESFFRQTCPVPEDETSQALAVISGLLAPSIAERHEEGIQFALNRLQNLALKRREWLIQDAETQKFRLWWTKNHPNRALCLSSMGPSLFVLVSESDVTSIHKAVAEYGREPLHLVVTSPSKGTVIDWEDA